MLTVYKARQSYLRDMLPPDIEMIRHFCSEFFVLSPLFLRNFCNTAVAEMCRSRPNLVFSHSAGKFPSTSGFQAKEVLRISIETKGFAFELEASMLCPICVQQHRRMPETL
jgi:hypothetical protein